MKSIPIIVCFGIITTIQLVLGVVSVIFVAREGGKGSSIAMTVLIQKLTPFVMVVPVQRYSSQRYPLIRIVFAYLSGTDI